MENKFSLSENAIRRINQLSADEQGGAKLRIVVDAGGCSGYKYNFSFENTDISIDDTLIERNGAFVVIDSISKNFLDGAELDFVENLGESYFEIKNPNAKGSCGCGNSFSV